MLKKGEHLYVFPERHPSIDKRLYCKLEKAIVDLNTLVKNETIN